MHAYTISSTVAHISLILPVGEVHLKANTSAEPLHTHSQLQVAVVLFITAVGWVAPPNPTPTEQHTWDIGAGLHICVCRYHFNPLHHIVHWQSGRLNRLRCWCDIKCVVTLAEILNKGASSSLYRSMKAVSRWEARGWLHKSHVNTLPRSSKHKTVQPRPTVALRESYSGMQCHHRRCFKKVLTTLLKLLE